MSAHIHNMLCLGDSYTIGEGLPLHESFTYQLVQQLRGAGFLFHAPEVVAKTGWTTFELAEHLIHTRLEEQYDFVTLLIGVNNQYRGLPSADFAEEFEFLLKKAIHLARGHAQCVVVLSIPDWGVSPFAKGKNPATIAAEIDGYNVIAENISFKYDCSYCDITKMSRQPDEEKFADDGLHYSASQYEKWAFEIAASIKQLIAEN